MNARSPSYAHSQPSQSGSGETAATILLVEDEPAIRGLAKVYLEWSGFRVIPAVDGEEAIALWQKCDGEIDLVLTDLVMPRSVNGHQLVQRLQAEQPHLKAIFVSGYAADSLGKETALGEDRNFLQKPYRLQTLVDMVYGCLERPLAA